MPEDNTKPTTNPIEKAVHDYAAMHRRNQSRGNKASKDTALNIVNRELESAIPGTVDAIKTRIAQNLLQQKSLRKDKRVALSSVHQGLVTANALLSDTTPSNRDILTLFEENPKYYEEEQLKDYAMILLDIARDDPEKHALAIAYAQEALHTLSYLHSKDSIKNDTVMLLDSIKNQDMRAFKKLSEKAGFVKSLQQVDAYGNTPLMVATELKAYNMIDVMIKKLVESNNKNAVLGIKNHGGDNVLDIARGFENSEKRKVYVRLAKPLGIMEDKGLLQTVVSATAAANNKEALKQAIQDIEPVNNTKNLIDKLTRAIESGSKNIQDKINSIITQAVYTGVSQAVLNRDLDEGDSPFLHQIIGMDIEGKTQEQKETIKMDCFNRLLDAGADPAMATGSAKSIFSSILEGAVYSANHSTALQMLEKLHSIGIQVPNDQRITDIKEAALATKSLAIIQHLVEKQGIKLTQDDQKTIMTIAGGDKFVAGYKTLEKNYSANHSQQPMTEMLDALNITRRNRITRKLEKLKGNPPRLIKSTKAKQDKNQDKKTLSDMGVEVTDYNRLQSDIEFAFTQGEEFSTWLDYLSVIGNSVYMVNQFSPEYKAFFQQYESMYKKNAYYQPENIKKLTNILSDQLAKIKEKKEKIRDELIGEKKDTTLLDNEIHALSAHEAKLTSYKNSIPQLQAKAIAPTIAGDLYEKYRQFYRTTEGKGSKNNVHYQAREALTKKEAESNNGVMEFRLDTPIQAQATVQDQDNKTLEETRNAVPVVVTDVSENMPENTTHSYTDIEGAQEDNKEDNIPTATAVLPPDQREETLKTEYQAILNQLEEQINNDSPLADIVATTKTMEGILGKIPASGKFSILDMKSANGKTGNELTATFLYKFSNLSPKTEDLSNNSPVSRTVTQNDGNASIEEAHTSVVRPEPPKSPPPPSPKQQIQEALNAWAQKVTDGELHGGEAKTKFMELVQDLDIGQYENMHAETEGQYTYKQLVQIGQPPPGVKPPPPLTPSFEMQFKKALTAWEAKLLDNKKGDEEVTALSEIIEKIEKKEEKTYEGIRTEGGRTVNDLSTLYNQIKSSTPTNKIGMPGGNTGNDTQPPPPPPQKKEVVEETGTTPKEASKEKVGEVTDNKPPPPPPKPQSFLSEIQAGGKNLKKTPTIEESNEKVEEVTGNKPQSFLSEIQERGQNLRKTQKIEETETKPKKASENVGIFASSPMLNNINKILANNPRFQELGGHNKEAGSDSDSDDEWGETNDPNQTPGNDR